MDPNNPPIWSNPSFMDFNSYGDQSAAQLPYTHPDWSGRPDQRDQRISGGGFNPIFQSSTPYLSQPNSYGAPPPDLVQVQQQQQSLRTPFSSPNPTSVGVDSSSLPGDLFAQSNEEYRRRSGGSPPQQSTTFGGQAIAQIQPPPALYHPNQPLDHPGGQSYRHQVIPLSDANADAGPLDLFCPSIHSRVPSQDGYVY